LLRRSEELQKLATERVAVHRRDDRLPWSRAKAWKQKTDDLELAQ
jgi:hypothetical protein